MFYKYILLLDDFLFRFLFIFYSINFFIRRFGVENKIIFFFRLLWINKLIITRTSSIVATFFFGYPKAILLFKHGILFFKFFLMYNSSNINHLPTHLENVSWWISACIIFFVFSFFPILCNLSPFLLS